MRLDLLSWPQVERYLDEKRGIIVPAGSTEQHGPSGWIGTDAICAESLARGVGEATGALVAPVLAYGMSEHHMAFAGSVALRPSTLVAVFRDVLLSLARHGFRRIFVINGHGGNTASLEAASFEAYAAVASLPEAANDLRCRIQEWWSGAAAQRLKEELFGDRDGDHASASEVSLARFAYPDLAADAEPMGPAAPSGPVYGAADFRRRYPDGRMGSDPSLASVEHGQILYAAVVAELAQGYQQFLAEE